MANKKAAKVTVAEVVTGIFYRDEQDNPLCPRCVEEQYPVNHKLVMEIVDEDEPTECDSCGCEIH